MSKPELLAHIFSLSVILLYSLHFFNQPLYHYSEHAERFRGIVRPSAPRLMTEPAVYHIYQSIFVALLVGLYLVLTIIIDAAAAAEATKKAGDNILIDFVKGHKEASIIISALAIIGVTKYPRWVGELVEMLRDMLHDRAHIPIKGRDLFDGLLYSAIDLTEQRVRERIDRVMKKNYLGKDPRTDLDPTFFDEINRKSLKGRWARLSYLVYCVEEYAHDKRIKEELGKYTLGWRGVLSEYIDHMDEMINYEDNLSSEDINSLKKEIEHLLYRMYRLVAALLMLEAKRTVDPHKWLLNRGFDVDCKERPLIPAWNIVRACIVIVIAITASTSAATVLFASLGNTKAIAREDMFIMYNACAAVIVLIPVIIAVLIKRTLAAVDLWPWIESEADALEISERPWFIYLLISVLCWVLSTFVLKLALDMLILINIGHSPPKITNLWPFTFIAFITTLIVTYRLDIPPFVFGSTLKLYVRRAWLAFLQGAATGLSVFVAYMIVDHTLLATDPAKLYLHCGLGFVVGSTLSISLFLGKHKVDIQSCQEA